MITFEKVSLEEYLKSRESSNGATTSELAQYTKEWEQIKLPKRATKGSAGYDFFALYNIEIEEPYIPHCTSTYGKAHEEKRDWATFPTGIRFVTDRDDIVLMCVPRSGLGFKNITRLANTMAVIDSDYQYSDNEGHIKVKMTADKETFIEKGKAFMQGIIIPFYRTTDDAVEETRNGGFSSTDKSTEKKA